VVPRSQVVELERILEEESNNNELGRRFVRVLPIQ